MSNHNCEQCSFRARYDKSPQSILGHLWRWHIRFCPGWKAWVNSLDDEQWEKISEQYSLPERMK